MLLPMRRLAAPAVTFRLVPVKAATKLAEEDSSTTAPVVFMFVVPAEETRSPIIETLPVAEPELRAPRFVMSPDREVTTPSVPPSKVIFPELARMSLPKM